MSLTDLEETLDEPSLPGASNRRNTKRRPFRRRWVLLSLFGAGILFLLYLNGPGFRALGTFATGKFAESQGLNGELAIEGTLWSGFSIRDLAFSPLDPDASRPPSDKPEVLAISVGEASLRYRALDLIRNPGKLNWLDFVKVDSLDLALRLPPAASPAEPEERRDEQKPPAPQGNFHPLWNLLETEVLISSVSLSIEQGDQTCTVAGFGLESIPGRDGKLILETLALPDQEPIEEIAINIRKTEHGLSFGPVKLGPAGTIHSIALAESKPAVFTFDLNALVAGGELKVAFTERQNVEASLQGGTRINLENLFPDRKEELPLEGTISDINLRFENPLASPTRWNLSGSIIGEGLGWEGKTIDTVSLTIHDNALHLEARRPDAVATLEASMPLEKAESVEDLQSLPIDVAAGADIADLNLLFTNLELDLPLKGAVSLRTQSIQLDAKGNLNSGNILFQTEELSWDGLAIPTAQVAAVVEKPNFLKLAANVGLDPKTAFRATGAFDRTALNYSGEMQGTLDSDGALGRWFLESKDVALRGTGNLKWAGTGQLEARDHRGEASLSVSNLAVGKSKSVEAALSLHYEENKFDLTELKMEAGDLALSGLANWDGKLISFRDFLMRDSNGGTPRTVMTLNASVPLDSKQKGNFLEQTGELALDAAIDRLELKSLLSLTGGDPPVAGMLNGNLAATGTFQNLKTKGTLSFFPSLKQVGEEAQVLADFEFGGNVSVPRTWDADLSAAVSGLQVKETTLGSIELEIQTTKAEIENTLHGNLRFDHAGTLLESDLQIELGRTDSLKDLANLPIDANALLTIENVDNLLRDFGPPNLAGFPLKGSLHADLSGFRIQEKSLIGGSVTLHSETLSISDQEFEQILIRAEVVNPDQLLADLSIALDAKSQAAGAIDFHLKDKTYSGDLGIKADLKGEGKLRSLLSGRNIAQLLPGTTTLDWKGSGDLSTESHSGSLDLSAHALALADGAVPIDLKLAGSYSEDSADFPNFEIRSEVLDLDGTLLWKEDRLRLSEWRGNSSGREVISLDASLPLSRESLGLQWFDQGDPIEMSLDIAALSIPTISRLFLKEAPLRGILDFDLAATGTPAKPSLSGNLELDAIQLPGEKGDIALGNLSLDLGVASEKADLSGRFQHPDLNPLHITAGFPFFPAAWARGERKFAEESVSVSAKMNKSSLAFLATEVPAIESIDGSVGINADLRGTLSKPSISGDGILEVTRLRLDNRDAPSFYDIDLATRFADNRLTVDRLHAIVAGGVVEGSGSVLLAPESEPEFNIRMTGNEVLLFRTPDLSLRTDADISLAGPLSKARLSGTVGITNSRFFKNFDLLPRSLPTRNTSALPTVERSPRGGGTAYEDLDLGLDIPPFRDWLADVRVYTKDPFLVRSNLVESDLIADINIGGTLGSPVPIGFIGINEGELTLPFSSVDVETGRIEFDEKTGFNGALEFKAQAKADKYRINVFLYNRVLDPKYVLTSVPPMPSEDLVSLLVTGTARQDLVGEGVGSMAAGKAATLLFKNMRKASAEADKEATLLDDLQERTELEIGGVNPETGEHSVGGKIRLWKQLFFVGDVDARNDYRAVLKYVFRFR